MPPWKKSIAHPLICLCSRVTWKAVDHLWCVTTSKVLTVRFIDSLIMNDVWGYTCSLFFLTTNSLQAHRKSAGARPSYIQTKAVSSPAPATSSSQHTILSIWGFGTLLKGTSAVLRMCTRTSSGASTSSNFLSLVPGTKYAPLPSLVPYRLTCTSLIFLFCCRYSVIVRGIQHEYNLDVVKL